MFRLKRILFAMFVSSNLFSQGIEHTGAHVDSMDINQRSIDFLIGVNYGFILDKGYSPNIYNYLGGHVGLGYKSRNEKRIIGFSINPEWKYMGRDFIPKIDEMFASYISTELKYSYLFYVGNFLKEKNRVYIGAEIYDSFSFIQIDGYSNNSVQLFNFLDLGPKLETDINFKLFNKAFLINYNLSLPIVALGIRPGYSSPFTTTRGIYFIGNYVRVNSETFLEFKVRDLNKFSIGYRWQFLHHNGINKLQYSNYYILVKFSYAI